VRFGDAEATHFRLRRSREQEYGTSVLAPVRKVYKQLSMMEDGIVVKVSPGATEAEELAALLDRLIGDAALRRRVGAFARAHADARRDPAPAASVLLALARDVLRTAPEAPRALAADQVEEGTLLAWALEEVRGEGRDLGLVALPIGLEPLILPLFEGAR
jgi:hypothetical protein